MVIIYSDKPLKGIGGMYISPRFFDGKCETAEMVYTSDDEIKKAYQTIGVEVKGFPRAAKPAEPKKEEVV